MNTSHNTASERTPSLIVSEVSMLYPTTSSSPRERAKASIGAKMVGALLGRAPKILVPALKELSFIAYKGDFIGLLGSNGAGKSTLLRILSGAEPPSTGSVYSATKPTLLGVSSALIPQLSGIDNAKLGLLALGLTPEQADATIPDIIDFAAIGEAIYRPIRTYSSGMRARLQFAISTAIRPDILLIDEALSTGDSTFQEKSRKRMHQMLANAGTIFLVSHSAGMIQQMCNRAIWLHEGNIVIDGRADEVSKIYQKWANLMAKGDTSSAQVILEDARSSYVPLRLTPASRRTIRSREKARRRHGAA